MLAISDVTGAVRNVGWRREGGGVGGRTVIRIALIITDAPVHQEADVGAAIASGKWDNLGPIDSWDVNDLDPFQAVGTRMTQKLTGESCPTSSVCLALPVCRSATPTSSRWPTFGVPTASSRYVVLGRFSVLCCDVCVCMCVCVSSADHPLPSSRAALDTPHATDLPRRSDGRCQQEVQPHRWSRRPH